MHDLAQFIAFCGILGAIALFLVQVGIALAVGSDAMRRKERKQPVAFFGPGLWFFASVLGGFVALALYWVMHYSSLRHAQEFPGQS